MTKYEEKKAAAVQRLEMLEADAVRVAGKIVATKELIARCDAEIAKEEPAK